MNQLLAKTDPGPAGSCARAKSRTQAPEVGLTCEAGTERWSMEYQFNTLDRVNRTSFSTLMYLKKNNYFCI